MARAKAENAERRRRVLAHADLAARLTLPPYRLRSPEMWTGFVPPRIWQGQMNPSPIRRQLIEIAAEAYRREAGQQVPPVDVVEQQAGADA